MEFNEDKNDSKKNLMFSTNKRAKSKLLLENKEDYIYFDSKGQANEYESETELFLVPNSKEREILYITGSSGCGKSTTASQYVKKFIKIFPNSDVYLFSRKDSDPAFDNIKQIYRIKIDDHLVENPINILQDCDENTLLIFDDIDSIPKIYFDCIAKIMYDLLEVGRSYHLYGIITSHLINSNNKKFSRIILNESHYVYFYKDNNNRGNKYYLENYVGLSKNQINNLLKEQTRSFCVHKFYPNYCITKNKIIPLSSKRLKQKNNEEE